MITKSAPMAPVFANQSDPMRFLIRERGYENYILGRKKKAAKYIVELSELSAPPNYNMFFELMQKELVNYMAENKNKIILSYIPTAPLYSWDFWRKLLDNVGFRQVSLGVNVKTGREIILYYHVGAEFSEMGEILDVRGHSDKACVAAYGCCMMQSGPEKDYYSPKIMKWDDKPMEHDLMEVKLHDNFYMAFDNNPLFRIA